MNLYFWQKSESWPRDPLGYVFLARAFDTAGKVFFGENWMGVDKLEVVDRLPPSHLEATTQQRLRAHLVLEKHFPDFHRCKPKMYKVGGKKRPFYAFSDQEWAAAYQFVDEAFQRQQKTEEQLNHIQRVIAEACEKAVLGLATRNETTGKMVPLDASIWNAELDVWGHRFEKCKIDPKNPLRGGVDGFRHTWIFITTDSLQPFLKALEKEKPTAQVKQTASQEDKCFNWLLDEMLAHKIAPKPKLDYLNQFRKEKKCLVGTRAFNRAWEKAKEAAGRPNWGNPGRKPKSKQVIDTPCVD